MTTRADIQRVARSYVGTPYVHQGRRPGVGLDCAGVLIALAADLGLHFPDKRTYTRFADGVELQAELDERLDRIEVPQPGDVVLLWVRRATRPQHVALLTDYGMLHSYADAKRVVETTFDEQWQKRVVRYYSFRGLA